MPYEDIDLGHFCAQVIAYCLKAYKRSPEPMLTGHDIGSEAFINGKFNRMWWRINPVISLKISDLRIRAASSQCQWVKQQQTGEWYNDLLMPGYVLRLVQVLEEWWYRSLLDICYVNWFYYSKLSIKIMSAAVISEQSFPWKSIMLIDI